MLCGTIIMFQSRAFQKRLRKIDASADTDRFIGDVQAAFASTLAFLPEPMQAELFDYFAGKYRAVEDRYTVDDALFLGEVVDLFTGEYDEESDPLDDEDWDFVKDVIDENALELDMETMNYVMKLVVDKGAL
jgi:hypothetical protein